MKTNRILALLLAAVMLLSIFTGCNTVEPNVTDPSGSIGSADHTGTDGTDSTTGTTDTTTGTEDTTGADDPTGTTGSDPAGNETISSTETTEPSTPPTTAPATQPTEPATEPSVRPTEPATEPTECSHSWLEWTTDSAATCEANGTKSRKCSRCGHTQTETIAATGHSWDGGTASADLGIMTYTCQTCGKTRTEQMSSNHTFGDWQWEEYTYTVDHGYTLPGGSQYATYTSHRKYRACTKCGYKETDGTADHICQKGSDNHVVTTVKEGTCTTKATMRSTCKICGWYVEYEGKKGSHTIVDKEIHLSDYSTYTNELDATVSECTSCGTRSVVYHKGEGWSDYNRYRVSWTTVTGSAYAGQPTTDNFAYVDHPEWQTVYRNFKYDSEGYVEEFTIYWWYNGSRYSQVINCGAGEMEAWFAEYGLTGGTGYKHQIKCFGTYWAPYKVSWTS